MTQTKKARLSAAIAATMGGAALSAIPFAGHAQDPTAPAGFSATETGQALIVPYYTVNGDWWTALNVTNTTSSALLVKVRFREAMNSRDVLDFNVMLSPYDVWTAYVNGGVGEDAPPVVVPTDNSCTTPSFPEGGAPMLSLAYTGANDDGGMQTETRMNEGYVEMLVIGECRQGEPCMTTSDANGAGNAGIGWLTEHNSDGVPRNCGEAQARSVKAPGVNFPSPGDDFGVNATGLVAQATSSGPLTTAQRARSGAQDKWASNAIGVGIGWGPVTHPAPLKGNVAYVNGTLGTGAGTQALHLDNVVCSSVDEVGLLAQASLGLPPAQAAALADLLVGQNCRVLATAQSQDFFLEPTLGTYASGLWNILGLPVIEERFTWSDVFNEWAANPETQAYTNWVINFPTKSFHVDQNCGMVQAGNNAWRNDGINVLNCVSDSDLTLLSDTGPRFQPCAANASALGCVSPNASPTDPFVNAGGDGRGNRALPFAANLNPFDRYWDRTNQDDDAKSLVDVSATVYDREEQTGTSGPIFSPAVANPFELPYETNVINFVEDGMLDPLESAIGYYLDVYEALGNPDAEYGWVDIGFSQVRNTGLPSAFTGLPVYGFAVKVRVPAGAPYTVGQMMDHGYGHSNQPE